jgi:glycerol-3-phosphate O-acyltransferase
LIDRLVYDPKVIEAIQTQSQVRNVPRQVLQAKVLTYAKEIVPSFNAYIYFRFGYWLAKKIARLLYRVRVDFVDQNQLASVDPNATVVFVMNHRSNMDYILVSFLVAERTALSYAVGEWAKIWPLQALIRSMGAFFVRRKSGDPLYRLVLERYIRMATKEGVCQAVFLEGGLSRDGGLQSPKLGLIDYMLRSFQLKKDRDIVFIPVGINYDRTLEDRSLLRSLDPESEKRSKGFVAKTTIKFIWHNLVLMARNKWQRFGYACVNFGPVLSAREYCRTNKIDFSKLEREERFTEVEKLCKQLMASIEQIVPILPVSLVASILLETSDIWLNDFDVKAYAHRLINEMEARHAPISMPKGTREHTIEVAFNMMKIRRMVEKSNGLFRAAPHMRDVLSYYANSISHWREPSGKVSRQSTKQLDDINS